MNGKMKLLLAVLAAGLSLVACTKKGEPFSGTFPVRHSYSTSNVKVPEDPIPGDDPAPDPEESGPSLLHMLDSMITLYHKDETEPLKHVFICSHRANTLAAQQQNIPENSVWAIEKAIELGSDMVELDVFRTSDGVLMIMHDPDLSTTTDGSGNHNKKTYEQIKDLRMHPRGKSSTYPQKDGDYVRVPTLEEALLACKDKIFVNLDLKDNTCELTNKAENGILDIIKKTGTQNQVMLFGGNFIGAGEDGAVYLAFYMGWKQAVHPYIDSPDAVARYVRKNGGYNGCAKLFQYDYKTYYDKTIERFGYQCHAKGGLSYSNSLYYDSQVQNWTSGSCTVLDRIIEAGTDFVQTDFFEKADAYLKTKGLR